MKTPDTRPTLHPAEALYFRRIDATMRQHLAPEDQEPDDPFSGARCLTFSTFAAGAILALLLAVLIVTWLW